MLSSNLLELIIMPSVKTLLTCVVCLAAGAIGASIYWSAPRVAAEGQPDPVKFERFLRRYYAWPADLVNVKIASMKPSSMPGFLDATIEASPKSGKGEPLTQG